MKQEDVLYRLRTAKVGLSAYDIGCSLNTLNALHRKGLVTKKEFLGSMFSPRTSIIYKVVQ